MEAPLVCLDEEFEDLRPCKMEEIEFEQPACRPHKIIPLAPLCREEFSELENFSEMMSFKSMEDLVNEFDEKLNVCFHNYNTKTEVLAPVRNQSHTEEDEERLQDEDVWDALTDNYIPSSVSSWDDPTSETLNGNLSDQEVNICSVNKLVIEEIVEMMENSPDPGETEEEEEDDIAVSSSKSSPSLLEEIRMLSQASNNNCSYEGLRLMPSSALLDILCRMEAAIREYSEELVAQLARRDELEFEKEVKNTFITALMEVQNRQKEQRELSKRRQTFGTSGTERQYLNTVIPYEKKGTPPSVDDLQMLTKILYAMKEDSEKVPTLLTDYILKVLCPT
uniref:Fasciculation and elongation protein zeta 1 n=1 Tax=Sinocyclocheilus grahami TaxID=75366 RepID=A0A672KZ56_SINGR